MAEHRDNPELRDLKYEAACTWFTGYRDLPGKIRSGIGDVARAAEAFISTADRIDSLMVLPAYIATQTAFTQFAKDRAFAEVRHMLPNEVGFGPVPEDILPIYERILDELQVQIGNTDGVENLSRGNRGVRELMLDSTPRTRRGIESILVTQIILAWTAFESLATDVWISAVNARPMSLGVSAIKSQRWSASDRPPRIHPPKPRADRETKENDSLTLDVLRRYRFDLSKKIGTMVWRSRKFNFNRLGGIQYAYSKMFGDAAKIVFQKYPKLKTLEAVRNLLVHKGGIIDEPFIERLKGGTAEFTGIESLEGKPLPIDGSRTAPLCDGAIRCGNDLVLAIDEWLIANPT